MVAVSTHAEHARGKGTKLPERAVELHQLGGTHEGEIEGPEEDRRPRPLQLVGVDDAEFRPRLGRDAGLQGEIRESRAQAEQS